MALSIAHVLTSLHVGGAERVALDLARHHVPLGHRTMAVSFETQPDGPLHEAFTRVGASVRDIPKQDGFDTRLLLKLFGLFRRERIRVVHTHNALPLIYAAPAAKLAGARVVHTEHGQHSGRGRSLWLRRLAAQTADHFVCVSDSTLTFARSLYGIPHSKGRIIENGVDLREFHPNPTLRRQMRTELQVPEDTWTIGTVGRLEPEKNHGMLLDAAAPLLATGSHLVIAGDGTERSRLRAIVASAPWRHRVHFLGHRRDVSTVLAGLDAFALSSLTEGLPLALLEAMAMALPVVATTVGGVPGVIEHGRTGLLAPPTDHSLFSRHLAALESDRLYARRLGTNARQAVRARHDADMVAGAYFTLYDTPENGRS